MMLSQPFYIETAVAKERKPTFHETWKKCSFMMNQLLSACSKRKWSFFLENEDILLDELCVCVFFWSQFGAVPCSLNLAQWLHFLLRSIFFCLSNHKLNLTFLNIKKVP